LHKTRHASLADTCAQRTAQRLGISAEAGRTEFKRLRRTQKAEPPTDETAAGAEQPARPSTQEFWLLKLVLLDDELPIWAVAHLDLNWVRNPVVRQVVSTRLSLQPAGRPPAVTALLAEVDDPAARSLITEAVSDP